jgi:hypothetical protein
VVPASILLMSAGATFYLTSDEKKMSTEKADVTAIIGKGILGAIPFIGPLLAEIVGT